MADLSDYRTLFGDDFGDIAKVFEEGIPDDLENLLVSVIDDIAFAAAGFQVAVNSAVNTMLSTGMSVQFVETTLRDNLNAGTGPFAALRHDVKKSVTRGINQSSRLGQYKTYFSQKELEKLGKKALFAWINVTGHKICVDCQGRAGEVHTFAEWEKEGLPGSGATICTSYCYCVLDPIGKLSDEVVVKGEKIKYRKISATEGAAVVNRQVAMAKKAEARLTSLLSGINSKFGTKFHGLKYALKERGSALRKFLTENVDNGWDVKKIIKKNLSDLNRYTLIIDNANYGDDVLAMIADLEASGLQKLKVKNYWDGKLYKGINTNWYDPVTGRKLEIQFNTTLQQAAKDDFSHKLYETFRDITLPMSERAAAEQELIKLWKKFVDDGSMPNGWEKISFYP
jgi:hypothetical protein